MNKKTELLNEIKKAGFPEKEVAISLDDFFVGNDNLDSIGVNVYPQPKPKEFYVVLNNVKSSVKTENIFVRISDSDDTSWFYTDTVYIVGDWTKDELKAMLKELKPDEIYEGWMYGEPTNVPSTKNKVYNVWWD